MSKVIPTAQMMALKAEAVSHPSAPDLDGLVAPTADDLMDLTLAAFDDVEPQLDLAAEQREALRSALKARLIAVLTGQAAYP
jgi:hypothetical protein